MFQVGKKVRIVPLFSFCFNNSKTAKHYKQKGVLKCYKSRQEVFVQNTTHRTNRTNGKNLFIVLPIKRTYDVVNLNINVACILIQLQILKKVHVYTSILLKNCKKKKTTLTFITMNKNTDIGTTLIIKSVLNPVTIILIKNLVH